MYEVNNSSSFLRFKMKERILRYFTILIIISVYVYGSIAYYNHHKPSVCYCDLGWTMLKVFHRYIPNFILIIVAFILMRHLKKSFNYEFKRLFMLILSFAIFQVSIVCIGFIGKSGGVVISHSKRTLYW